MAIIPNWFLVTFTVIIPSALLCLLQWWLSGRRSCIPGLILPALHLIVSIVLLAAVAIYAVDSSTVASFERIDSATVEQSQETSSDPQTVIGGADGPTAIFVCGPTDLSMLILPFLLLNIPTGIDLILYALQRRKLRQRQTVDKTRIQDM